MTLGKGSRVLAPQSDGLLHRGRVVEVLLRSTTQTLDQHQEVHSRVVVQFDDGSTHELEADTLRRDTCQVQVGMRVQWTGEDDEVHVGEAVEHRAYPGMDKMFHEELRVVEGKDREGAWVSCDVLTEATGT